MATFAHACLLALAVLCTACGAFGYNYSSAGVDWKGFCNSGEAQSPINIVTNKALRRRQGQLLLKYQTSKSVTVYNVGPTVQVIPDNSTINTLTIASGVYKLAQVHFHVFSEHAINGMFAPMEAHFVHVNIADKTKLAVVGVLLALHPLEKNNTLLAKYLPHVPKAGAKETVEVGTSFSELLSGDLSYYTYPGSLTTPLCNQTVTWHVLAEPRTVSVKQVTEFELIMSANSDGVPIDSRLPQPTMKRQVMWYASGGYFRVVKN